MKNTRSTREAELREHDKRLEYNMGYVSPLALPPGVAREDYDYYWVAKDIRGEPCYEVERLAAQGWEIVPVDRAPGHSVDPLKRNPLSTQYFCYKDVILMERPLIFSQRQTADFNRKNSNILSSLRGVSDDFNSFASPVRSINSF